MKYLVAMAIVSLGLSGLNSASVRAGDGSNPVFVDYTGNTIWGKPNIGPCGPDPCKPSKPDGK